MVPYPAADATAPGTIDDDIINLLALAAPETKHALRLLLERIR